jgi:DNA-binding NarL/FixJ family response regulator
VLLGVAVLPARPASAGLFPVALLVAITPECAFWKRAGDRDELIRALRAVHDGGSAVDPQVVDASTSRSPLSARTWASISAEPGSHESQEIDRRVGAVLAWVEHRGDRGP